MTTAHEILKKYWNYDSFRPMQEAIVQSVLAQKNTLAILPTGGGKSICFQVPALILDGFCLVITPLVALMRDQVEQLRSKGISAAFIDASFHTKEIFLILENAQNKHYKFLYVSPERLQTGIFLEKLPHLKICLVAIDEAHCISEWGHDFRPSYLQIAVLRNFLTQIPFIALTATATQDVKTDIISTLELKSPQIFVGSFARPNLSYVCFKEEDKIRKMLEILRKVNGCGIVYVRSRAKTKLISDFLVQNKIEADFYHAGLSYAVRANKQEKWTKNKIRVIVATNAFGMGIDKPDVRLVIHLDVPESLEAYYQEAGRAGRDTAKAYPIAIYSQSEIEKMQFRLDESFPDLPFIKKVYQILANYLQVATGGVDALFDFDVEQFQHKVFLSKTDGFEPHAKSIFYALKALEQQNFIQLSESFYSPAKLYVPDKMSLYQFQIANSKFDPFIRIILRLYGGEIYTDFVKINELQIAKNLQISEEEVVKWLTFLDKQGVLVYQPRNDKPKIAFLQNRYEASQLPFDSKRYWARKEVMQKKLEAVKYYFTQTKRCRTQVLQAYFGEITEKTCGVCDNCIQNKKNEDLNRKQIEKIKQTILTILTAKNLFPSELRTQVSSNDSSNFEIALRELLEEGIVTYLKNGMLEKL
jgi:ATP-dependent DNA helicase RecQ